VSHELVVFPSSYLEVDPDGVWTTGAMRDFIVDAREYGWNVTIAAPVESHRRESRHDSRISDQEGFQLFELEQGLAQPQSSLRKLLRYCSAWVRILTRVPQAPLWYIFIPNHMGVLACLTRRFVGKRFGMYVRGEWPKRGLGGFLHRRCFKRADFIITTGGSFAESLRLFNDQVMEVAPMMRFGMQDICERNTYAIHAKAKVLYVGALSPAKGVVDLVKAAQRVMPHCPFELQLVGAGSQEQLAALQAEIEQSGHAEDIKLLGYVGAKQELKDLYLAADLFAFPTYYPEGFPRVVYEAMSFGLPVISTDFEGGRHSLRDFDNCRLIGKRDVEMLANCLQELLQDESARTKLGTAAIKDAKALSRRFEGVTHGRQAVEAACVVGK